MEKKIYSVSDVVWYIHEALKLSKVVRKDWKQHV